MRYAIAALLMVALLAATPASADVLLFTFENITRNHQPDADTGQAQLLLGVAPVEDGRVRFTFSNSGPDACTIGLIAFENPNLLGDLVDVLDGNNGGVPGVAFGLDKKVRNLPGGNSLVVPFHEAITFQAHNPRPHKGVNPGEWVSMDFQLAPTRTLEDVVAGLSEGWFRVGMHVQAFSSGGSEAFITSGPAAVPEPATLALLAGGSVLLIRRRRTA